MKHSAKKGFTLIELIISISIIALMVGSGALMYSNYLRDSRDSRRKLDVLALRSALELFRANNTNGVYPVSMTELVPTYIENVPVDPKGVSYSYTPTTSLGGTCNNAGNLCVTYTISIVLETTGINYTVRPNSTP